MRTGVGGHADTVRVEGEDEWEGGEDTELRARGAGPEGDGVGLQDSHSSDGSG